MRKSYGIQDASWILLSMCYRIETHMIADVGWNTNSYLPQYATRLDGIAYVIDIKMKAEKMQQPLTSLVVLAILINAYAAIDDILDPNPLRARVRRTTTRVRRTTTPLWYKTWSCRQLS